MREHFAIFAEGLTKSYGPVKALRGVNLAVDQGEIFGFLGPNGAGKTTTIRCMVDLIRPNGGVLEIFGVSPQGDPVQVRARMGYLPGEPQFDSNMTGRGALDYFSSLRRAKADWDYVGELAGRLNIDLKVPIKNLSHGNKQKIAVIAALMHNPELLILDEPTTGLDPLVLQEVLRLLREAQEAGTTIFLSSHIISVVEAIADRVGIIRNGVVVEIAETSDLLSRALRRARVRFREPVDTDVFTRLPGVQLLRADNHSEILLQVTGDMDSLVKVLAQTPLIDIETERPSLEEIFLAYYSDRRGEMEA